MVTLNKPSAGDTDWATEINDNWTKLENQLTNAFQGRLEYVSSTQVALMRYVGDIVDVNGQNVSLGSSGIALDNTENLITSTKLVNRRSPKVVNWENHSSKVGPLPRAKRIFLSLALLALADALAKLDGG